MGEALRFERFEKEPIERLQDEIERLEHWLREPSPAESAEEMINGVRRVFQEVKDKSDFHGENIDLAEIEGTIVRIEKEARIKEANRILETTAKSKIEEGPEKHDGEKN